MKRSILKGMALFLLLCSGGTLACAQQQKQDTIVVSRDGTGKYRDIQEAVEAVRAFMDYTVTIFIKNGIYKEKLVIPDNYPCHRFCPSPDTIHRSPDLAVSLPEPLHYPRLQATNLFRPHASE